MRALGQRASFWVSAAVICHTLWTSAAPTLTYPLYAAEWHLTPTVTTSIFAVYPIVLVGVLLLFGDLSDTIGRRATMLLGLAASLIGVFLFAIAPNVGWVFVGRAFMGIGVGLSASPATAAMVEFSAPGQSGRASLVTTIAQAAGLAFAAIVGGALIEYAPFPTRLNFWALFIVIAGLIAVAWFLPRPDPTVAVRRWQPRALVIAPGLRLVFATSTIAVTAAYAIGTIMLSLGAQIARDLIGSGNALVTGGVFVVFAGSAAVAAILAKRFAATTTIVVGGLLSVLSLALLMVSASDRAFVVFLLTAIGAGIGYSLMFLGGLTLINARVPATHRAGTLSAIYLVAYLMQGVTAIALGMIATAAGLQRAIDIGAPAVAAICLATVAFALCVRQPLAPRAIERHS
jgi:predicted MFS family arabinose efflux permease